MKKSAPLINQRSNLAPNATTCHPELDSEFHLTKDKKCFVSTGFTLIELLVVIVIIGILATIGVAQFNDYIQDARYAKQLATIAQSKKEVLAEIYASGKNLSRELSPNFELADGDMNGFPDNFVEYYYPSAHPWSYSYNADGNFVFTSTKHVTGIAGGSFSEAQYMVELRYRRLTDEYAPLYASYPDWNLITNEEDQVDRWYSRFTVIDIDLNTDTSRHFYLGRFADGDSVTYEIDHVSIKKIQ